MSTCSLCSLIPQYLSQSWLPEICCHYIQFANLILKFPLPHFAGAAISILLFINLRSFPLVWHANVLLPFGIVRCKYLMLSLCHIISFRPLATRHRAVVKQLESCCPVGTNPFELTTTSRSWASPDETDWFGHVSNSTYAKARDAALSKFGLAAWQTFVNAGGSVVLGSTHYHFVREIPRFVPYEMTMSIGAWDNKWLYLVCRFKSRLPPKTRRENHSSIRSGGPTILDGLPTRTFSSESKSSCSSDGSSSPTLSTSPFTGEQESDGMTLHCFTVSRLCFKMRRITVPPAIVMACEGFSKPPKFGSYSRESPPPHWVHPQALRSASDSLRVYRRFLAGGWKDVPEGEQWWIEPLSGPIEERRCANLARLEAIDGGLIGCMDI